MSIWRVVKQICINENWEYPQWASFRNLFSKFEKAGLVRKVREVEEMETLVSKARRNRRLVRKSYYRLNPDQINNTEAWGNVTAYLYPDLYEK